MSKVNVSLFFFSDIPLYSCVFEQKAKKRLKWERNMLPCLLLGKFQGTNLAMPYFDSILEVVSSLHRTAELCHILCIGYFPYSPKKLVFAVAYLFQPNRHCAKLQQAFRQWNQHVKAIWDVSVSKVTEPLQPSGHWLHSVICLCNVKLTVLPPACHCML